MRQYSSVNPLERIISAASYLTTGVVGFIWWIIAVLMKKTVKPFLMYHILQSIFLSIAYFLFIEIYKILFVILAKIPLLNSIAFLVNGILYNPIPVCMGYSLLQTLTTVLICYLVVTSFCGQFSYIPYVSNIIKQISGIK